MRRLLWIGTATALVLLGCASPEHQMSRAIKHGNAQQVKALIQEGCDVNGAYREMPFTHQALGQPAILATLLEAGATADEELFDKVPPMESSRVLLDAGICPRLTTLADLVNRGQTDLVRLICEYPHCQEHVDRVYETLITDGDNLDHDMLTLLNPDHRRVFVDHLLDELQRKVDEGTLDTDDMERFAQRFPEYARQEHATLFSLLAEHAEALKNFHSLKDEAKNLELSEEAKKGFFEYIRSLAELWLLDPCIIQGRIKHLCDEKTNYYLAQVWQSAINPVKWDYSDEHGVVAVPLTNEEVERTRVHDGRGYISATWIGQGLEEAFPNKRNVNLPFSGGFVIEEALSPRNDGRIHRQGQYKLLLQSTADVMTYPNPDTGFDVHIPILILVPNPSDPQAAENTQAVRSYFETESRKEKHQQQLKDAEARCEETLQAISNHLHTPAAFSASSTAEPEPIPEDASTAPVTPKAPSAPREQANQADPETGTEAGDEEVKNVSARKAQKEQAAALERKRREEAARARREAEEQERERQQSAAREQASPEAEQRDREAAEALARSREAARRIDARSSSSNATANPPSGQSQSSVSDSIAASKRAAQRIAELRRNDEMIQMVEQEIRASMVFIKPGKFKMGDNSRGMARHRVIFSKGFYCCKYEITQAQWERVMGFNPSYFQGPDRPVEQVSWHQVQAFIEKLNAVTDSAYRLPTEPEWEYACRSGKLGNFMNMVDYTGWYRGNAGGRGTRDVGLKTPNLWDLYDMSGNVAEWCQDGFNNYPESEVTDPAPRIPNSTMTRVVRGGHFHSSESECACASRDRERPDTQSMHIGFRLVRTAP